MHIAEQASIFVYNAYTFMLLFELTDRFAR